MEKLGASAKCAPPLRDSAAQQDLWKSVASGAVTTIGSDHSPAPQEMKTRADFFQVWGGISGVQHSLPLMITEGHVHRNIALTIISRLTSFNVAQRFGITPGLAGRADSSESSTLPAQTKGMIAVGGDADFAVVKLGLAEEIHLSELQDRHKQSPYVGRYIKARVVQTILRGNTIFSNGKIVAQKAGGRFVRPLTSPAKP
jgi:allantoinase